MVCVPQALRVSHRDGKHESECDDKCAHTHMRTRVHTHTHTHTCSRPERLRRRLRSPQHKGVLGWVCPACRLPGSGGADAGLSAEMWVCPPCARVAGDQSTRRHGHSRPLLQEGAGRLTSPMSSPTGPGRSARPGLCQGSWSQEAPLLLPVCPERLPWWDPGLRRPHHVPQALPLPGPPEPPSKDLTVACRACRRRGLSEEGSEARGHICCLLLSRTL